MSFEQLGVDVTRQILLEMDYQELARFCVTNRYINSICKSETFWQEKYFYDFGPHFDPDVASWSQLYKYKYASLHKKKIYSLIYSSYDNRRDKGESETLITASAKNQEQFIEFLVAMYNDEEPNEISDILIPIINRAIPLFNFNILKSQSELIDSLIQEYLRQNPNIQYIEYGNKPATMTSLPYIFRRYIYNYYLTPEALRGTHSEQNTKIVFDLFRFFYNRQFANDQVIDFPQDEHKFIETVKLNENDKPIKYYTYIDTDYLNRVFEALRSNEIDKGVFDRYTIRTQEIYVLP